MFITVSIANSGNPILVNLANVLYINEFGSETEFHFKNSSHTIVVREPFGAISRIIYNQQIPQQTVESELPTEKYAHFRERFSKME